jgi:alpha-amylase/alpha-mannosidase (GH57 family)
MPATSRQICIHGHFYQPPRENPWLEAVETQDSASPYHDWNERISAECYGPNASARILDERDRILKIVNNYASISFNFGPTLLSWLQSRAPDTYAAILEADRISRERFSGHGSAIAQAYNHIILPLANDRDKATQVRWGISDFERRFGRKPEAMWLPETAVDINSLEALAAEGITFTILEPHQAKRYRRIGEKSWTDANGGVDPTMPYRCPLPSGRTIAIFFYDGPISRAVAFEKLLARGENLAHRLIGAFSDTRKHVQIVNIATDGETYGHHHKYGDMALAYALHYIEENELVGITNYGEFLAAHPPTHEVEIVERTAWSCSHGVERWRSDCGCNAGGAATWTQQWRTPLRDGLDWLRDETIAIFEQHATELLRDPWEARDEYIDVVLDRSDESADRFFRKWGNGTLDESQIVRALELLEAQRNSMLMYTSCGWFFSDVSGIETLQVLSYAARVIQLMERVSGRQLEAAFREKLNAARSNLTDRGTARQIYDRDVAPMRLDLRRVAAHYAVSSLFDNFDDDATVYCYRVQRRDFDIFRSGRARMAVASIVVTSLITRESAAFDFSVLHLGETELTGGVRPATSPQEYERIKKQLMETLGPGGIPVVIRLLDQNFADTPLSIRSLLRDEQRRIFNVLCNATLEEAESAFRQLHERYDPLMRFHTRLGIPVPKVLHTAAEFDVNVQLRRLLEQDDLPMAEIEARMRESTDERLSLDESTLLHLERAIARAADRFREHPEDIERLESFQTIVSLVRGMDLRVSLRKPQNEYYEMKAMIRPVIAASNGNGTDAGRWLELFDALGDNLFISPEAGA